MCACVCVFLSSLCGVIAVCGSACVAQWIARLPPKEKVAGSNPASGTVLHGLPNTFRGRSR